MTKTRLVKAIKQRDISRLICNAGRGSQIADVGRTLVQIDTPYFYINNP